MTLFAQNIEKLLSENKISQKEFTEKIGVNKSAVIHWREGAMPAADVACRAADYFGVSVEWLVTGTDPTGLLEGEGDLLRKWRAIGGESRRAAMLIIDDAYSRTLTAIEEKKPSGGPAV